MEKIKIIVKNIILNEMADLGLSNFS